MNRKQTYTLTDGTETTDVDAYIADWGKFRTALENFGLRVIGFDPSFTVCDAATNGGTFTLPLYAAKRILNLA